MRVSRHRWRAKRMPKSAGWRGMGRSLPGRSIAATRGARYGGRRMSSERRAAREAPGQRDGDRVLVVNSGSSSVKYQIVEPDEGRRLAAGVLERIGEEPARWTHRAEGAPERVRDVRAADHREAFLQIAGALRAADGPGAGASLAAIGHRVVHGGA